MRSRGRSLLLVAWIAAMAACGGDGGDATGATGAPVVSVAPATGAPGAGEAAELQVYAAASLRKVLERVTAAYEAVTPGVRLTVSTDSSAALAAKIEQGAPADVFLSADMANPQALMDAGLAAGPVAAFAGNHLVVIVPPDNPAGLRTPADLAAPGVRIIAAAEGVPVEAYTIRLLDDLVAEAGLPAGFPDAFRANIASREDNAGAIVAKVALGEGDAGVVYVTDAVGAAATVATIELPAEANPSVTYGGVVVGASASPDAAAAFLAWLAGPDGQALLSAFGFLPVS